MKAYYFVFFIMFLISLFYQAKGDKQWRWKLFWSFLPLFIYAAIRVDYGNDYPAYENLFEYIHAQKDFSIDRDLHAEVGYQLLNVIMPSYRSILVLTAFLLSFSLGVFCYNNVSKNYLWLVIILVFLNPEKNIFGNLVGIRNGLVVTSFLLGFVWIQKRKLMPFAILTFALAFFHKSAILYLPIAYIAGTSYPFKRKEIWIWGGAAIFLFAFSMSGIANIIGFMIDNEYLDNYQRYLKGEGHRGGLMMFASVVFMVLYIFYLLLRSNYLEPKVNSLMRIGLLYNVTMLMGSLSMRASYFYDMFLIASSVIIITDKKAPQVLRLGVLVLLLATSFFSMRVWMHSPWWNHGVYHSLIGSW